jgi:hypothetical protein
MDGPYSQCQRGSVHLLLLFAILFGVFHFMRG